MFSVFGKRKGKGDPLYNTHRRLADIISLTHDVAIIENVAEYDEQALLRHLNRKTKVPWKMQAIVIDPRLLGFLAVRTRKYVIAWRTEFRLQFSS